MITINVNKYKQPRIFNYLFKFYLWLNSKNFNKFISKSNNNVFDKYGIIDTMGNRQEANKYTSYYGDEFVCIFTIKCKYLEIKLINV